MILPKASVQLRVYLGEGDRWEGRPLFEAIVLLARERGLAGATVLRSPLGYGAASRLHTASILRLSEDLPMVVEVVDDEAKIRAFLPELERMMDGGLVTLNPVEVLHYHHERRDRSS
jgi:uncharacterized protein